MSSDPTRDLLHPCVKKYSDCCFASASRSAPCGDDGAVVRVHRTEKGPKSAPHVCVVALPSQIRLWTIYWTFCPTVFSPPRLNALLIFPGLTIFSLLSVFLIRFYSVNKYQCFCSNTCVSLVLATALSPDFQTL